MDKKIKVNLTVFSGRSDFGQISGQVSLMAGLMTLTFIFLFAFVINTAMLVNAKINLQNAADLAAYAGAAVQARQLNTIGFLNYEMRRHYKKFLFKYYVAGNLNLGTFPRGPGGTDHTSTLSTEFNWDPVPLHHPSGPYPYNIPTVCMPFGSNDNYCQKPVQQKIVMPSGGGFGDPIQKVLIEALEAIEDRRRENCRRIGIQNRLLLFNWLYNLDPDFSRQEVFDQITDINVRRAIIELVKTWANGVGLVPREVILKMRIKYMESVLNTPSKPNVNFDSVSDMKTGENKIESERTIQAFLSAYYTLGNHTFGGSQIFMDELMSSKLIDLNETKIKFSTFATDFFAPPNSGPADCTAKLVPIVVKQDFPITFYKKSDFLTYYAIKLKAKARVLFSPIGDIDLVAYSAAQPFGSRIGSKEDKDHRENFLNQAVSSNLLPSIGPQHDLPNLPIRENENSAGKLGWNTREALARAYSYFAGPSAFSTLGPSVVDISKNKDVERAAHMAMAPNPYEKNRYLIPTDNLPPNVTEAERYSKLFDSNRVMPLVAPLAGESVLNNTSNLKDTLTSAINELFGDTAGDTNLELNKLVVLDHLRLYVERMEENKGEDNEGLRVIRLKDPFYFKDTGKFLAPGTDNFLLVSEPAYSSNPDGFLILKPTDVKNSWNNTTSPRIRIQGRVGYSVKYVSFDSLTSGNIRTDRDNQFTNTLVGSDPETLYDFVRLKH